MRKTMVAAAAAALMTVAGAQTAEAGCYRWGDTGYHWYRYCAGPRFMYPHYRHCRWRYGRRYCWYS
jgi:opacity protein-like surface antigen